MRRGSQPIKLPLGDKYKNFVMFLFEKKYINPLQTTTQLLMCSQIINCVNVFFFLLPKNVNKSQYKDKNNLKKVTIRQIYPHGFEK
jgi:hypothetical protein